MKTEERIELLERTLAETAIAIAKGDPSKLHAIRAYRAAVGVSLKDAKDFVESFAKPKTELLDDARVQRVEDRLFYLIAVAQ
jgi:ribosomal protein L7/L12